jgi:hypothetical protein
MLTLRQLAQTVDPGNKEISVRRWAGLDTDAKLLDIKPPISLRKMLALLEWNELYQFKQSTLSGVWPHIGKDALVEDIRLTVLDPLHVNQKSAPLCGPTAVVYELVARQPHRFVQFCRQLWEKGFLVARGKKIKASATLKNSPNPPLSPANWILIATLREDENLILEIDNDVSKLEGFTGGAAWIFEILGPSPMKTWTKHVLGYNKIDSLSTILTEEMKALGMAHNAWKKGGVAFLLINSDMLSEGEIEPELRVPNHWVAYHGGLQVDPVKSTVAFNCYSWGKIYKLSMKIVQFTSCMFGVVRGSP